ncbi:serum response factor-like [Polypterus senegalus]|uniref:serum response factor-like n=1 Tax=Polypterus senegalus TaxID=55291 RepID=UPI00196510CD|nr:serum response factor-like [Polypterus senegalus]
MRHVAQHTSFQAASMNMLVTSECHIKRNRRISETLKPAFTVASLPGTSTSNPTAPTTSTTMQVSSGPSFPITNYLAPVSASSTNSITSANGTVLKAAGTASSIMQIPSSFTFMSGTSLPPGTPTIPIGQLQPHSIAIQGQQGQTITATAAQGQPGQQTVFRFPAAVSLAGGAMAPQLQAIQVHPSTQHSSTSSESGPEISQAATCSTVTLPATIVTSSVPTSVAGHMMYPSPHAVMYASTPTLADGSLAVLNAFSQTPSGIQVSHGQVQEQGGVPQVFLTAPPGTVQIPVQLHPMVIGQQSTSGGSNLTELQVVNLEATHNSKDFTTLLAV